MNKVLLVGPALPTGGLTRYVNDLLKFKGRYHYILFNTARPKKDKIFAGTGYIELFNAGIFRTIQAIILTIWHIVYFPYKLMLARPDIVHVCGGSYWTFWENAFYILISKLVRCRVTMHYLGAFDFYYNSRGKIERTIIRKIMGFLDYIILLSEKVHSLVKTFISKKQTLVIPSNVDTSRYQILATDAKRASSEIVKVLFVGGLDPFRKGIYDLLDAATKVIAKNNNVRFIFTGGASFKEVSIRWHELGLDDYIDYKGWISENEKVDLYHSIDVLVLPSYNEGLPYVIIEAMASGLPIVSTNVGGISEVVQHSENGYIIEPGDIENLAKYLLLLISDPKLRRKMSEANRRRSKMFYSTEAAFGHLEDIFDKLILRIKN